MDAAGIRIFDGNVNNTSRAVEGMPAGQGVAIACDGDVLVEWWIPTVEDYDGTGETISAPGGLVEVCPHHKCQLTTTASVNIGIVKRQKDAG